jgi:hypothetical protein
MPEDASEISLILALLDPNTSHRNLMSPSIPVYLVLLTKEFVSINQNRSDSQSKVQRHLKRRNLSTVDLNGLAKHAKEISMSVRRTLLLATKLASYFVKHRLIMLGPAQK